jgi:phosphoribosylaminoimidazole-succinocarboxamide synthase
MTEKIQSGFGFPALEAAVLPESLGLRFLHSGKVRDIFTLPDGDLALVATDRISAFDRVLGTIPGKGAVLTAVAQFWFENTRDIIPNHLVAVPDPNVMVVRNVTPLPVEVVVRGYMTGSTDTSIWGSYKRGERIIYGLPFRDGYRKNDPLDYPIITPTTKATSGHDERLTEAEIIRTGLVPVHQWQVVREAALALFSHGQKIALDRGFVLFDTKFEFGVTPDGQVILIDEVLTPDSSRYAIADTLAQRIAKGLEPDFYDKEYLRLYFKEKLGYSGQGEPPEIPEKLRVALSKRYQEFAEALTGEKLRLPESDVSERMNNRLAQWLLSRERERLTKQQAVIIMGSSADQPHAGKITSVLDKLGVTYRLHVGSAHKTPEHVLSLMREYDGQGSQIVYIAIAGRSNALGGFLAANTRYPVINSPPPGEAHTIFSSLEMPSGVEGVTVLYPEGAALLVAKIFALTSPEIAQLIIQYQEANRQKVLKANQALNP